MKGKTISFRENNRMFPICVRCLILVMAMLLPPPTILLAAGWNREMSTCSLQKLSRGKGFDEHFRPMETS